MTLPRVIALCLIKSRFVATIGLQNKYAIEISYHDRESLFSPACYTIQINVFVTCRWVKKWVHSTWYLNLSLFYKEALVTLNNFSFLISEFSYEFKIILNICENLIYAMPPIMLYHIMPYYNLFLSIQIPYHRKLK